MIVCYVVEYFLWLHYWMSYFIGKYVSCVRRCGISPTIAVNNVNNRFIVTVIVWRRGSTPSTRPPRSTTSLDKEDHGPATSTTENQNHFTFLPSSSRRALRMPACCTTVQPFLRLPVSCCFGFFSWTSADIGNGTARYILNNAHASFKVFPKITFCRKSRTSRKLVTLPCHWLPKSLA